MPDKFITIIFSGYNLGYSVLYTCSGETTSEIVKIEDLSTYVSTLAAINNVRTIRVSGPISFATPFCDEILETAKTNYGYNDLEIEVM